MQRTTPPFLLVSLRCNRNLQTESMDTVIQLLANSQNRRDNPCNISHEERKRLRRHTETNSGSEFAKAVLGNSTTRGAWISSHDNYRQ